MKWVMRNLALHIAGVVYFSGRRSMFLHMIVLRTLSVGHVYMCAASADKSTGHSTQKYISIHSKLVVIEAMVANPATLHSMSHTLHSWSLMGTPI